MLGKEAQIDPTSPQVLTLQRDVIALYTAEYAKQWDALLADLDVEPMRNLQQAVQELYILASPQSPMRDLLAGITRQLTLTQPPPHAARVAGAVQGAAQAATAAAQAQAAATTGLQGLFGSSQRAAAGAAGQGDRGPLRRADHFRRQGTGRADRQRAEAAERSAGAARQAGRRATARHGGGASAAATIRRSCCRPRQAAIRSRWRVGCRRWRSAATSCAAAARWIRRRRRSARRAGPASLCKQAVAGRYPFTPGSTNDIPLDDFARLFATGGLLDKFFNDNLQHRSSTPPAPTWKAQPVAGVAPPVTPADLAQFQRASQIRDLFFAGGGNQPTVRFDITPMDTDAKQVTLDLDGLSVVYAHGPISARRR